MQGDSPLTTNVLPLSSPSDFEPSNPPLSTTQRSALVSSSRTDLIGRDLTTGKVQSWRLDGSTPKSQALLTLADSNDQLAGTGDFNGNQQDDLLWWNARTGEVKIWTIDGTTTQQLTLATVSDTNWRITNTGDFNQDGKLDLLWHNFKTGETAFWLLNGTSFSTSVYLPTTSDLNWEIETVGDFGNAASEGGGRSLDIQWRNRKTGAVDIWLLDKTRFSQSVSLGTVGLDWDIKGVGDFNGTSSERVGATHSSDLLWRNAQTGENALWFLNGTQLERAVYLPSQGLDWKITSIADFNRDGSLDLLWHNTKTGENSGWFLNQGSFARKETFQTTELNWQPLGTLLQSDSATEAIITSSGGNIPSTSPLTEQTNGQTTAALSQGDSISTAIAMNSAIFTVSDQVNGSNLSDFYRFSLGESGVFTANLAGLSGDADIKLIQDANNNGAIDGNEVLAYQWERGTANESLRRFLSAGTYYIQVLSYRDQASAYGVSTNFAAMAQDDQKFSLNLNFGSGLEGLQEVARAAIVEAAKFWENIITNRSAITEFRDLTVTISGQSLVGQAGLADTSTLALSGPTFGISASNDLVIRRGASTINARRFADFNSNPLYLRNVMIHELAHVLGFGTAWEPVEFVDYDGTRFSMGKNWIDRNSATYAAGSYAGYAYGDLLGETSAVAVPVEPQVFAHWDETRYDTELMTPYAEGSGVATPLSILTLAALRDLGWSVNSGATDAYALPRTVAQQVTTESTTGSTSTARQTAALQCGCAKCVAALLGEPLAPTQLEDAIAASRPSENTDAASQTALLLA
jgi:hypothetical protein